MALTRDNPRKFDVSNFSAITAGAAIYEGAAVGVVKTTGLAIGGAFNPSLHRFAGIAKSSAAIGARVTLQPKGRIILTITGATDASTNAVVYASDDDTFNLTGAGISVGRIAWHQGAAVCVVEFDAATDMDGGIIRNASGKAIAIAGPQGAVPYDQRKSVLIMSVAGHSFAEQHSMGAPSATFALGYGGRGNGVWACHYSRGVLRLVYNAGVGGESSTAYLARQASVLAIECDIILNCIGVNDFGTTTPVTLPTIKTNLESIWRGQLAAGRIPVQYTVTAVDVTAFPTYAARQHEIPQLNAWIVAFAAKNPWLVVVDEYASTINSLDVTNYKMLAIATYDGLHKTTAGGSYGGLDTWNALKRFAGPRIGRVASNADSRVVSSTSDQLIPNPMLVGTAGTAIPGTGTITGTVPDGWTANNLAGSPTVTLITAVSPSGIGNGLRIQVTSAGSCQFLLYPTTTFQGSVVAGDSYYAEADIDIAAMSLVTDLNFRQRLVTAAGTTLIASMGSDNTTYPNTAQPGMTFRTPDNVMPASTTIVNGVFAISISAGGSIDIVFSRPEFRKVV